MKIKIPSTRDQRPVLMARRPRLAALLGQLRARGRRVPWLYVGASVSWVLAGWLLHPSLGLAIAGVMFMILEVSGDDVSRGT